MMCQFIYPELVEKRRMIQSYCRTLLSGFTVIGFAKTLTDYGPEFNFCIYSEYTIFLYDIPQRKAYQVRVAIATVTIRAIMYAWYISVDFSYHHRLTVYVVYNPVFKTRFMTQTEDVLPLLVFFTQC
jgi:hypothetical protein